ncbi:hypothetical protein KIM67_09485 [Flagellimonas sp. 389]|uniref:toxin-antitoxin system YwqK family antitoxin n=1 Tax=Flagellimonas sp. 389 TaxID=2835862 RepID=UPI001BD6693A|nr:hypothetical protein [Flagellimonas sp. 389]MBS9462643.1 hypothetical protein [Flagellimonas sp. 389]
MIKKFLMNDFGKQKIYCVLTLVILCSDLSLFAQNDTIWYDAAWKTTDKNNAAFFRPPVVKSDGLFLIKDFYINGQIQMEGVSKFEDKDYWHGEVTWYNNNGSLLQKGNYVDNKLEGKFITSLHGQELTANYENGKFVSGKQNIMSYGTQYYKEIDKDTVIEITHKNGLNGIRGETYTLTDEDNYGRVKSKYYDKNGKLVAQMSYDRGSPINGSEAYFRKGLDGIYQISYYKNKTYLGADFYDISGQIREELISEPDYKTVYYDETGKELGEVSYRLKENRLVPVNGKKYAFDYKKQREGKEFVPSSISNYKNERLSWVRNFKNGKLFSYTTYSDKNYREKILYYDTEGAVMDSLLFKNYAPYEGTELLVTGAIKKYKDGKLLQETVYYPESNIVFKKRDGYTEQFFNKSGAVIGKMILDDEKYYAPKDGEQFTVDRDGRITSSQIYKDSKLARDYYISYNYDTGLPYKEEKIYDTDGYNYKKKISYYSNGQVRSDIDFENYKEVFGKFYDEQGTQIGSFDYKKNEGTLYEFFYGADRIKRKEIWKDGKNVRLLRYEDVYVSTGREKDYVLMEDIDVTSEAKIYDRSGVLLSSMKFKDGEPFEGTFYDHQKRNKHTYKNGLKDGLYEEYGYGSQVLGDGQYKAGLRDGKFTFYDTYGKVTSYIHYINDKLEGEAAYFDGKGNTIANIIYKNDAPYQGKMIVSTYNDKRTELYEKGKLVSSLAEKKTGDFYTIYKEDGLQNIIVYYPSSKNKKYEFVLRNNSLDGTVDRYNMKGAKMHSATFRNGNFIDGELWMVPIYNYNNDLEKIRCVKTKDSMEVEIESKNNGIVFKASEKIQLGLNSQIEKLNLGLNYINYKDLY